MRRGKALAIAAMLILATHADAGAIRGRLRLSSLASQPSTHGMVVEAASVQQAVLWVDLPEAVADRYRAEPRSKRVVQSNRRFAPLVTPVPVGSTIDFANRDKVYHNVFSVSPAQRFDLGKYAPSSSHRVQFDHPGVVNLFCDIHPWMSAYVVVVPHRVFAVPKRSGEFKLPKLPPGKYTLHLWHPSFGERQRVVEVAEKGDVVLALSD